MQWPVKLCRHSTRIYVSMYTHEHLNEYIWRILKHSFLLKFVSFTNILITFSLQLCYESFIAVKRDATYYHQFAYWKINGREKYIETFLKISESSCFNTFLMNLSDNTTCSVIHVLLPHRRLFQILVWCYPYIEKSKFYTYAHT